MSAEVLRRAAALMRERAEAASRGEWTKSLGKFGSGVECGRTRFGPYLVANNIPTHGDAEHIASWHPVVALAVADWLERLHDFITDFSEYDEDEELTAALRDGGDVSDWPEVESALTVARAYLGEQP